MKLSQALEPYLDQVSFRTIFILIALVIIFSSSTIKWLSEERKVRSLGAPTPRIRTYMPLGLDHLFRVLYRSLQYRNLESWDFMLPESRDTVDVNIFNSRWVMTADPENIKAILATQFQDFGKGLPFYKKWSAFLGDSIFTTDGDLWHGSRKMIKPLFAKDRVSDLEVFERHVQDLFKAIDRESTAKPCADGDEKVEGRDVEIADLMNRHTLDVATDFLLGRPVGSLENPQGVFEEAFEKVQHVQSIIARTGPLDVLIPKGDFNKGIKRLDDFVLPFIESVLAMPQDELASKSDSSYTFLHALAQYTRDRDTLRDQLMSILIAGRDTTAGALAWTFYELAKHPEVVEKLRHEIIQQVGPDAEPTYDNLKNMKYLQNTLNEVLRMYPIIPFNVRMALRDTTLPRGGGPDGQAPIGILKDTPIFYSTLFLQRRAKLYPKDGPGPLEFCPDRWYSWQPQHWTFIPFNGGPRICLGQQFALAEMGYTIVRCLQRFKKVEPRFDASAQPRMKADIVLRPADGVHVRLVE